MSQLIPATNSWGVRQSWNSAAIHKTKEKKGTGQEEGQKVKKKKRKKGEVIKAVNMRPEQQVFSQTCEQG